MKAFKDVFGFIMGVYTACVAVNILDKIQKKIFKDAEAEKENSKFAEGES